MLITVETPVNVSLRFYIISGLISVFKIKTSSFPVRFLLVQCSHPLFVKEKKRKKKKPTQKCPKNKVIATFKTFHLGTRILNLPPVWGLWTYFNLVLTACNPGVWYELQWVSYPPVLKCSCASGCTKETVWKGSWNEICLIEGYTVILNHTSKLFWLHNLSICFLFVQI